MRRVNILLATVILLIVATGPAGAVTVRVLNHDGTPAAGVPVSLQNGSYAILGNGTTDASGAYVFAVSSGPVRAVVGRPYNASSVWHDAADAAIEIRLPAANEIEGTIKLDGFTGNPVVVLDDIEIFDSFPYDVSRQNGSSTQTFTVNRFSLATAPGRHVLYAAGYSDGRAYMSDRQDIYVSGDRASAVLEMKCRGDNASILPAAVYERIFHTSEARGGMVNIAGRLIGADGMPLANATLTAQDYFLKEPGSTVSGPDGAFAFGPMYLNTDIVRFKVVIRDNGTEHTSLSSFYPVQYMTYLDVRITDYPKSKVGYIYGIISRSANRSSPVPISGTVYLSNGLMEKVSPEQNISQFIFTVAPGPYEIYAEHTDGGGRLVSGKVRIEVEAAWSPAAANPVILVVEPEKTQYIPLIVSLAAGALCLAGAAYSMKKWL